MTTVAIILIRFTVILIKAIETLAIKTNNYRLADQCIIVKDAMHDAGWA